MVRGSWSRHRLRREESSMDAIWLLDARVRGKVEKKMNLNRGVSF
jgi:hypothetical protein